jgi:predicted exporter
MQRRRFAWAWAFVVCLLFAHQAYLWLGQRIVPDTDILALLPVQQRDPVLQQSFTHMVETAQQRVVVLVGAADWENAKRAADAYSGVLATKPALLQMTQLSEQTQADWLTQFRRHSLVLMTAADEAQLRRQPPQYWADAALSRLYSPFSGPKLGAWRDDPFGLFGDWIQERAQETPVRPRDGRLFVAGGGKQYVLLPLL